MTSPFAATRNTVARRRAKATHRVGQATVRARPETLRESLARTGGMGVGLVAESGRSYAPFASETERKRYEALYDPVAMGRIARALREPLVQAKLSHDNGTAPELHIVGKFLHLGWIMGKEIHFQDTDLFGFRRRHRVFVSDVALDFDGRNVLVPVDGEYFHDRLAATREDDIRRNATLARLGQVCPVPSRYCFEGATLDAYLDQRLGVTV